MSTVAARLLGLVAWATPAPGAPTQARMDAAWCMTRARFLAAQIIARGIAP